MIKKVGVISGWIGMVLIQCATVPTTIKILYGTTERIPPMDMVLLVWAGLFLFLVRSIINRDALYIVSNSTGIFFQSLLLIVILIK